VSEERLAEARGFWLIRRDHGIHYICWYDRQAQQRKYRSTGTRDFQAAETALLEHALAAGSLPKNEAPSEMKIAEVLLRYYNEHRKKRPSEEEGRIHCAWWMKFYSASETVADLTKKKQSDFHDFLLEHNLSKSYAHKIITTGRAALNHCLNREYLSSIPRIQTYLTKKERLAAVPKGRPMKLKEIGALLDAFGPETGTQHMVDFIITMTNTVCRPGAALDLDSTQIDDDMGVVNLNPEGREQTDKYRPTVTLTSTMAFMTSSKQGRIVNIDGKPVTSVRTEWNKGRERAKLDNRVVPYSLRHTMIRLMAARNVPLDQRKIVLGHQSKEDEVTRTYCPDTVAETELATRAIEDIMRELQKYTRHPLFSDRVAPEQFDHYLDHGPTVVPFRRPTN
jgi:site-specific recombinase XerD